MATDNQFWRVRVCLPGSIIHLASETEPVVHMQGGRIGTVTMSPVADKGDTAGFIDWPVAIAVTWRREQVGIAKRTRPADQETAKAVFCSLLWRLGRENRKVSERPGANYAPALFAKEREARDAGCSKEHLAEAMRGLLEAGLVVVHEYDHRHRHRSHELRLVEGDVLGGEL